MFDAFENNKSLREISEIITGMTTGNNKEYLKIWYEINFNKIAIDKHNMGEVDLKNTYWIPYNKGGNRRNWFGNNEYVVNWAEKDNFNRAKTTLERLYLRKGLTWPFITSGNFSARFFGNGFLWDVAGSPCFFDDNEIMFYTLGFLCSKLADMLLNLINPTINVQAIDLENLPFIYSEKYKDKIGIFCFYSFKYVLNFFQTFKHNIKN